MFFDGLADLGARMQNSLKGVDRRIQKLTSVLDVAKAMTSERNLDQLLDLILREAAKVVEADRCSLFIRDREKNELWSKVAQGAQSEIRVPMGIGIAGSVAETGQAINLQDAYADQRFRRAFDALHSYRTSTILCVPMRDASGEVTGVLQALNKQGGTFDAEDEELLTALGGQAAVAIESAMLHKEIAQLFEGFVSAAVVAIESRDPSTAGHSGRVANLTVELARSTEHSTAGTTGAVQFDRNDIQEIRYASLLHDFGKVGVRESVLVKADKLYPHQLELLKARFQIARKDKQLNSYQRRLNAVSLRGMEALPFIHSDEEALLALQLAELDEVLRFVLECNRPSILLQGGFEKLVEIGKMQFFDDQGQLATLLSAPEMQTLSIPRGSLSTVERLEIESHVTHTFRFLSQIPWTRSLKRVPEIAYSHHEKMDGSGYPRSMAGHAIPIQSKMMAICDVYDALTAADRPYKKAIPHDLALDILHREAEEHHLDPHLLRIFIEAEVPRKMLSL